VLENVSFMVIKSLLFLPAFNGASAFKNGVLNQWDVASVTTMAYSKSILIVKNNVT
jgi:hypothetical protein